MLVGTWDGVSAAQIASGLQTRYFGQYLICLDQTTSTQDRAKEEAEGGAAEGTAVLADEQSQGRGRFQRTWVSPKGGAILLSLVLRPPPEVAASLPIVTSLAVAKAVRKATGLDARIKWPNDIQIGGKKLAGILLDASMRGDGIDYVIAGIGLNIGLDPEAHPAIAAIATSISREVKRPVARLPVFIAMLQEMEELYEAAKRRESLIGDWRSLLVTLGQRVQVMWLAAEGVPSLHEEGVAEDVNDDGALLIRKANGSLVTVTAGEVSLRP